MRSDKLPPPERRIGVKEAAKLLKVHWGRVYRMIWRGELGAWRLGGRYILDRDEVLASPRRVVPKGLAGHGPRRNIPSHAEAVAHLRARGYYAS